MKKSEWCAQKKEIEKKKSRIGITWKMFAIFILFVTIVVSVTWLFQIQSLTYFYQYTKFTELEAFASDIEKNVDEVDLFRNDIEERASANYIDVWVIKVKDGKGDIVLRAYGTGGSPIIPFISHKIETLYAQAKDNGGTYIALAPFDKFRDAFSLEILADNTDDSSQFPILPHTTEAVCALHAHTFFADDSEYMILQISNLTPLSATVSTLEHQFMWSMILMIIAAFAMALIMTKVITKPFIRMNEAAKRLAEGKYDADFTGHGYREINELADTLNYAARELAKEDRFQKELISNISHDLRTPLTMIKGYSEVMRDIPGENTPENVQVIIDETARLSELVNGMLDLSKITSGARPPQLEYFSLTETVRESLTRYEKLRMQEGYRIEFFAFEDAAVHADKVMILQVIYNLINNAINYTGDDKFVSVTQEVSGGRVRISVTDTGEGIESEHLPYIWDRYYKVDKVHKRATVGTGLGLSIVKGILEAHKASYGVTSVVGKGSTFWFELSVAENKEEATKTRTLEIIDTDYEKTDDNGDDNDR